MLNLSIVYRPTSLDKVSSYKILNKFFEKAHMDETLHRWGTNSRPSSLRLQMVVNILNFCCRSFHLCKLSNDV